LHEQTVARPCVDRPRKGFMTVLHVRRPLLCGVLLAALFPLAGPAAPVDDLDKAGRQAFAALRDFQKLELAAYRSATRWPSSEQHQHITQQLTEAYDGLTHGLVLGLDRPNAQVVSFMRASQKAVDAVSLWVMPLDDQPAAPANVIKALAKARTAYAAVLRFFPPVVATDEQLTR